MGAQQILDAILAEAKQDADAIINDAVATSEATVDKAKAAAEKDAASVLARAKADAEENARRDMLGAQLTARKSALQTRRQLLDEAFSKAVDALCALPDADYEKLIVSLALGAVETGSELLQVSADDTAKYTKPFAGKKPLLETLNDALTAAGKPGKLSLAKEPGDFKGGFCLIGELTDIDCSFDALIANYRDAGEPAVSALIFGEKEG